MKKLECCLYIIAIMISCNCFAVSKHQAVGIHGMALLKVDNKLIASHMPLHNSIHAHQVVFEVEVSARDWAEIKLLFKKTKLVSAMPEVFDLHQLISGSLTRFRADIFQGHFERGGQKRFSEIEFTVSKMLLSKKIQKVENGIYYVVDLESQQRLLIHRIGRLPSFDQILLGQTQTDLQKFKYGNDQPLRLNVKRAKNSVSGIEINKILYTEIQDFQVR